MQVILSSQSQKLRSILAQFPASPFCLYLTGVPGHHLASILAFIYCGQVRLSQADLPSFLSAAENLQVSGLLEKTRGENTEQEEVMEVKEEVEEKSVSLIETVTAAPVEETKQSSDDESSMSSRKIIKLHTADQAREERERLWDDVETVSYEFIKTGKSKAPGMLTTHDRSYKVWFS